MLYYTFDYIALFLPAALVSYFGVHRLGYPQLQKPVALVSSIFFYGFWNLQGISILLGSALINFWLARSIMRITSPALRRVILVSAITFNLLLLSYFKYYNFFVDNIGLLGMHMSRSDIFLPLGISFFTFQKIALLVDAFQRRIKEISFIDYALFVSFFPQLVAGPIVHHSEIIPQFNSTISRRFCDTNFAKGVVIFAIGFFKKLFLADQLGAISDRGYSDVHALSSADALTVALAYTFQLYFDFSGYMDMGFGSALMFNIVLPRNFNSPYKATNIQDFWRRWHITLGRFLRDYVFIPLGGSKNSMVRTCVNLLLTFLIGGLWHGAAWTFVVWGAWHGTGLVVHRLFCAANIRLPVALSWATTFMFVVTGWVFFRAASVHDAFVVITKMAALPTDILSIPTKTPFASSKLLIGSNLLLILASFAICLSLRNTYDFISSYKPKVWHAVPTAALFVAGFLVGVYGNAPPPFIYFNF